MSHLLEQKRLYVWGGWGSHIKRKGFSLTFWKERLRGSVPQEEKRDHKISHCLPYEIEHPKHPEHLKALLFNPHKVRRVPPRPFEVGAPPPPPGL